MQPTSVIFLSLILVGGCAAQKSDDDNLDLKAFPGHQLTDVVRANHLDQYHNWPAMNQPPGVDAEVTYFLPHGDLDIRYAGDSGVVTSVQYSPTNTSADERYKQASDAWEQYVAEHESPRN